MANSTRPKPSGSEAEAILGRAIELQHEDAPDGPALTAADLEEIAEEMGIEPRYVRAALAEKKNTLPAQPKAPDRFYLWGGPGKLSYEALIDQELDQDACDDLINLARQRVGSQGKVRVQGKSVTWRARRVRVALLPRGGQTHLWLSRSIGGTAVALFVPILIPVFLGLLGAAIPLGIIYSALWTSIFGVLFGMALAFGLVRALFASIAESRRRELEGLKNALLKAASAHKGQTTLPSFDASESAENSLAEEVAEVAIEAATVSQN